MSTVLDDRLCLSNLMQPEVRADPYPLYRELREADPVHWDAAMGFWVLTRYADIVTAYHEPRLSKAEGIAAVLERLPESDQAVARPVYRYFAQSMLYADPPYHTRLRGLVNKAFTPRRVERMVPAIQRVVDELVDAVEPDGALDVIAQFAFPLPARIIMDMLGLPAGRRDQFRVWSNNFAGALGLVRRERAMLERAQQSLAEFAEYLPRLQSERREHPTDDLLNALFSAEEQGNLLNQEELIANALLLLSAGHETTVNLIGNGLLALLRHPDQMQRLKDEPELIPAAVEEALRYDNPVQIVWRQATADVALGDRPISRGQYVNLMVGAANRDPAQFRDPDRFDVGREEIRHVGFSLGSHFCLGAPLARLEAQIAFETLLRRLPNLRLEAGALEWQPNPTFRGLKSLPVRFG